MTNTESTKDDDYYPFRWKVADFAEDVFVLHRTAVVGVLALLGLGFILLGFLVLGWGSNGTTQTATEEPASTNDDLVPVGDNSDDEPEAVTTTVAPTTSSSSTTTTSTTTSTTTTSTTTTVAESARAATTPEQLAATPTGAVIELTPGTIRLIGGFPTDAGADDVLELAELVFPGLAIEDSQVVDESFPEPDVVTMRLAAADLFEYNRDSLNSNYLPLIDQLASALSDAEGWSVEVSGHTDDTGPSESNQRLSERRASSAAQRLISQGVAPAQVTSVGRGEDQPIAPNSSEAGRLANRRVEFAITR